jgi:hypothetical protein
VTLCLITVASSVALAAAIRSTWSPCGLSMLSTITPFSERAKGHSYRSTAAWFVLGATVGGATLGSVMFLLALGVHSLHLSAAATGALAFGAALVAAASDSGVAGARLPVHRRQVNERWLDQYRSWVYGSGFGWQIGNGLSTYITSAALYLMVVLGALTATAPAALAIGIGFGLVRGLAVLLTRHLGDPASLRSFHRRFADAGPRVGRAVVAVELVAAAVIAAGLRSPSALAIAAGSVAVVAVAVAVVVRPSGPIDRAASPGSPLPATAGTLATPRTAATKV